MYLFIPGSLYPSADSKDWSHVNSCCPAGLSVDRLSHRVLNQNQSFRVSKNKAEMSRENPASVKCKLMNSDSPCFLQEGQEVQNKMNVYFGLKFAQRSQLPNVL